MFSTHDMALLEAIGKDVGRKGNVVFEKHNGITNVTISDQSPVEYMRAQIVMARKEAGRVKV